MLLKNVNVAFHWIENIVEKEENAGYQHFLLFLQCFQMAFPQMRQKSPLCGKGLILLTIFFLNRWLLVHIVETMMGVQIRMNPVPMTFINPLI